MNKMVLFLVTFYVSPLYMEFFYIFDMFLLK